MYKALSVRCQRCTKKNKKKIMLRCIVIGACAVHFLYKKSYANVKMDFFINLTIDEVKLIKCEYISHTTERLVKKQIRMEELL